MPEVPSKSKLNFEKLEQKIDLSEEKENLSDLLPVDGTFYSLRNLLLAKNQLMGNKNKIFQNSNEIFRDSILPYIKTVVFSSDHDKPIGTYTPGESKMDYQRKRNYYLRQKIMDYLMPVVEKEYIRPFVSKHKILVLLMENPEFEKHREEINQSLDLYYQKEYSAFIRSVLPEFEGVIRDFLKSEGEEITEEYKDGAFKTKPLNKLLDNKGLRDFLDKDEIFYFKFLSCDKIGYNLRNRDLHDLSSEKNRGIATRLLWSLGYLSLKLRNTERELTEVVNSG